MEKLALILHFIFLAATLVPLQAKSFKVETWATRLTTPEKEKTTTNLQFYFHDTLSGKTPSAVKVAGASNTDKSPTLFGAIMMVDDPLTEGPDPKSKLLGRAQGFYGSAGQAELGLLMAMTFGFTDGMYSDSCISLLGKNPAMNPVREMPIVGGTGVFRLAHGFAFAQTHWLDPTTEIGRPPSKADNHIIGRKDESRRIVIDRRRGTRPWLAIPVGSITDDALYTVHDDDERLKDIDFQLRSNRIEPIQTKPTIEPAQQDLEWLNSESDQPDNRPDKPSTCQAHSADYDSSDVAVPRQTLLMMS
ncbi:hypothetical protein ACFE04_013979 [Oxalis oulophora]